ncbi:hypothetical protein FDENT_9836 [Fusarium denticulatum]|uniref:Uncharacterized protein n=1 Tax=Fusarium denticulatum TaxID=48507 RepID=A0A8H5TRH5_9HYPO|nr:hypothetical protein FDENT_9836 [Fusarium denticulatum]
MNQDQHLELQFEGISAEGKSEPNNENRDLTLRPDEEQVSECFVLIRSSPVASNESSDGEDNDRPIQTPIATSSSSPVLEPSISPRLDFTDEIMPPINTTHSPLPTNTRLQPAELRSSITTASESGSSDASMSVTTETALVEESPFSAINEQRGYISAHNQASSGCGFILLAVAPKVMGERPGPKEINYSVYQASREVVAETGSFTFAVPCGPPLHWAWTHNSGLPSTRYSAPRIVVVTGCSWEPPAESNRLFATDYMLLSSTNVHSLTRHCVMTMPSKNEARFLTLKEMQEKEYHGPETLEAGYIAIKTDTSFQSKHPAQPFVGIGAIDPYCHHRVIPVITWQAWPNRTYILKPDMSSWTIARKDNAEVGSIIDTDQLSSPSRLWINAALSEPLEVFYAEDNTFTFLSGTKAGLEALRISKL